MRYFLYLLIYAPVLAVVYLVAPFHPKLRRGLRGRRGLLGRLRAAPLAADRPVLWFHVASSGELEQCLPLLDRLKKDFPSTQLVLTYFSPSAKVGLDREIQRRRLCQRPVSWDFADYAPFDFPWTVRAFLREIRPRAFISIHRELWPGILNECRKAGVARMVFAAYVTKDRTTLSAPEKWLFGIQDFIGTIDEKSANTLLSGLSGPQVKWTGDPRIERVKDRRHMAQGREPSPNSPVNSSPHYFVLASVWDEDLDAVLPAVSNLLSRYSQWKVIIVPHEASPLRVKRIEDWFRSAGHAFKYWTENSQTGENLLVTRTGVLAELYHQASLVFVGGSFKAKVHNVLEPAAYGKPILTGPFIQNSLEARELAERGALVVVSRDQLFDARLQEMVSQFEEHFQRIAPLLSQYLNERSGASEHCLSALKQFGLLSHCVSSPLPL